MSDIMFLLASSMRLFCVSRVALRASAHQAVNPTGLDPHPKSVGILCISAAIRQVISESAISTLLLRLMYLTL